MKDYSRRDFIKQNSLAGLSLLASGGVVASELNGSAEVAAAPAKITTIGGMTLKELRDKYRKELFENYIPNMDKYAIDHENGGVMCSLDVRTGVFANTNKTAWFVGRGVWVYSFLYNNLEQNPRYLEIARKSKDLLLKLQPKDDSFWPRGFAKDGSSATAPGDIYASLFVAEGLIQYAKASGEQQYRDIAKKIMFGCGASYDKPEYTYNYSGGGMSNVLPKITGTRVLGHWMILLSLSTQALKIEPDADLEKLAARCVDSILNYHVNKDYGLTNEIINHDFTLPDNAFAQFCVTGHGLETLAFVMFEAARRKDTALFRRAEPIFKRHVDVAHDALYGGYFSNLQQVDARIFHTAKYLWCQQEVLNGSLFLIEHTGDEWATRHFARTHAYIYDKFYNPSYKFWHSGGDRKMAAPSMTLLEHYHHARELMLGIMALERMIKRGGKPSGLFA